MSNALYYGDNLKVLRESIADESVDLIYLDPPFNSNASYNILFKSPSGTESEAQIEAFDDTWHWGEESEHAFDEVMSSENTEAAQLLRAMRSFLGENDMMAYLAMMAVRLLELHRVLKLTGSLFLHCDPTASHYLKILLDAIFDAQNFRNEIIWKRTTSHNDAKHQFPDIADYLLFYAKSDESKFFRQYGSYSEAYLETKYRFTDKEGRRYRLSDLRSPHPRPNLMYEYKGHKPHPNGWAVSREKMAELDTKGLLDFPRKPGGRIQLRRYLDERSGMPITTIWDDIRPINAMAQERLGYPTQKPLALLERVINSASLPDGTVLDPFCGCGTAVHAAQKLDRQWIGIDITHLAISLVERRLKDAFPGIAYEVHGTPKDLAGAMDLAQRDKYQFQWWAVGAIGARPWGGKKKGPDTGIDGILFFKPDGKTTESALVSVKGGENTGVGVVRDLHSVIEREKAKIGVLITAALPTRAMEKEAAATGFYKCDAGEYPRIQIITLAELFQGKRPRIPLVDNASTFRAAKREQRDTQQKFDL